MNELDNAYAIIIGIGNDLPASARDAIAIKSLLSNTDLAGYKDENISLLIDKEATRDNILKSFDDLIAKVNEDSSVFLFYSGHGGTYTDNDILELEHQGEPLKSDEENETHYYWVPNNFNVKKYRETWILADELKEKIQKLKTRRLILFLDCCHAEGMTKAGPELNSSSLKDRLMSPEGIMHRIDDGKGMSIISACRAEEKSWIIPEDAENSVFTNCLLEALRGESRESFDEPFVRMTDTINYLMKKVPEIQPIQRPFVNLKMYDNFILSRLPNVKAVKRDVSKIASNGVGKESVKEVVASFRQTENATSVILFVHGFSGEADASFGTIPQYIMEDPKMNGWDLFPIGYTENVNPTMGKGIWASLDDISRLTDNLTSLIQYKYKKYNRITIIGHSLGGLAVQRAILNLNKESLDRIKFVLLFGTPSNGVDSKISSKLDKRLKAIDTRGTYIKSLRNDWNQRFIEKYPFELKVVAGTNDDDIPISSSLEPFDKANRVTISGNHFSMVHPNTIENDAYQLIVDTLSQNTFSNKFTNEEEINNLLGEYDAVINKLLPSKDTLNVKGLKQLLFALEGLGRNNEVMDILQNNSLSKENTDLIGLLGGRFKRKYLQTFEDEYGRKSFDYYAEGLRLSLGQNDNEQIYYHAINLAFMSLVYEEDKQNMREYGAQALEAAKKDPFDSIWKNATIAEAYMYMADFKNAQDYYTLAAKNAGIREKISMHTNAYLAYKNLMATEDDEFITFLKNSFLS